VLKARQMYLAGGEGPARHYIGFGHSSHIHTTKILWLSQDLPIVIKIVDSEKKINGFLAVLNGMIGRGLVTLEEVKVLRYGNGKP
jgi:PII-like signaling protein